MEKVVLDTSVIVKWFVDEEGTEEALKYLEQYRLKQLKILIPAHLPIELTNALYFGTRLSQEQIVTAIKAFFELRLDHIDLTQKLLLAALPFTQKHGIAIYDALFIALAEVERIPLITADRKHHQLVFSSAIRYL